MEHPDELTIDRYGLGRLDATNDLRQVWASESNDFTPWLAENIHMIGDLIGLQITVKDREVPVGGYRLDLLAETEDGRDVVIENQLASSDHSHLGQLLVYASAFEPAAVVWIARTFRDEHRRALEWLNERTDEAVRFFAVEVRVVSISGSAPAPVFSLAAQPSDVQKAAKESARGTSALTRHRMAFFQDVVDLIAARRPSFSKPKIDKTNWVGFGAGPFGDYEIIFDRDQVRVEVRLDGPVRERNKALFDELHRDHAAIESSVGYKIDWIRNDDRNVSRLVLSGGTVVWIEQEATRTHVEWTAATAIALMDVLNDRLRARALALRAPPATGAGKPVSRA